MTIEPMTAHDHNATTSCRLCSIVIPTYKEAENLQWLIPTITQEMTAAGIGHEIIIVDDNSRDGSDKVLAELAAQKHNVRLETRLNERGLSTAVIHGMKLAQGDVIVCMDADGSHPPSAVPKLVAALQQPGIDMVIGSRYVHGASTDATWGLFRWLNSKVATVLAFPFTRAKDPMSGFFGLRRATFEHADELNPLGYKIGLELIVKCRCRRIAEVPIHFADRKLGQTKLSLKEQVNYVRHLKRLANYKFGWFSHFVQFAGVGATGMVVDLVTYAVLWNYFVIPFGDYWRVMISRAIAIYLAMNWNFLLNRRLTFSHSRGQKKRVQYPKFIASSLLGAVLSWSIAMLLTTQLPLFTKHPLFAAMAGIVVGLVSNFLCSRHWVFKRVDRE